MPIDLAQGFVEPLKDGREPTRKNMSRPEYRDETETDSGGGYDRIRTQPEGKEVVDNQSQGIYTGLRAYPGAD